jgi:hypothetical protein
MAQLVAFIAFYLLAAFLVVIGDAPADEALAPAGASG